MKPLSKTDLILWRGRYGPIWRFITARNLAGSSGPWWIADRLTVDLGRFLRLQSRGGDSVITAARAFPQIAEAFCLQQDKRLIDSLRIMILGKLDSAEIVARTGLAAKLIGLWRAIFFDVDMGQDPMGWHITHVVWPELQAGNLQLASKLHHALCLGPLMARRLLDGPEKIPTNPREYAELVRRQTQMTSFAFLMHLPQSRQELQKQHLLGIELMIQEQEFALTEKRLASRSAKEQLDHALAERRVRLAEQRAEDAAARRAAKAQAKAENEQLRLWHREQAAAHAEREHAERQARIAASKLLQLPWGNAEQGRSKKRAAKPASAAGTAPHVREPLLPRSPGFTGPRIQHVSSAAPGGGRVSLEAAEAAESTHPAETLST